MICYDRSGKRYQTSTYKVNEEMILACAKDLQEGGDPDDYHPTLLLQTQVYLYYQKDFPLVKKIAEVSSKRLKDQEFDNMENWTREAVKFGEKLL